MRWPRSRGARPHRAWTTCPGSGPRRMGWCSRHSHSHHSCWWRVPPQLLRRTWWELRWWWPGCRLAWRPWSWWARRFPQGRSWWVLRHRAQRGTGRPWCPRDVGGEAGQTLAKCFEQSCTEKMTLWTLWQQVSQSSVSLNFAFTPGWMNWIHQTFMPTKCIWPKASSKPVTISHDLRPTTQHRFRPAVLGRSSDTWHQRCFTSEPHWWHRDNLHFGPASAKVTKFADIGNLYLPGTPKTLHQSPYVGCNTCNPQKSQDFEAC